MSSAPSGSSVLQHIQLVDPLKIRDRIIFEFYSELPHMIWQLFSSLLLSNTHVRIHTHTHTSMPLCFKRLLSTTLRSSVPCKYSSLWGDPVTRKWANQNHFSTCHKSLVGVCVHIYVEPSNGCLPEYNRIQLVALLQLLSQHSRNIIWVHVPHGQCLVEELDTRTCTL